MGDPLRGISLRSRTVKKSRDGAGQTKHGAGVSSPLNHLCAMFPGLKRNVLADILHSNDGVLEQTVDQVLSLSVESKTPFPDTEAGQSFSFPSSASEGSDLSRQPGVSRSQLPPCPECPVCRNKRQDEDISVRQWAHRVSGLQKQPCLEVLSHM